jgi:hypothetical protein
MYLKALSKNPDLEYYKNELNRLKVKVWIMYNKRKSVFIINYLHFTYYGAHTINKFKTI